MSVTKCWTLTHPLNHLCSYVNAASDSDIVGPFSGDGADGMLRERLSAWMGPAPPETIGEALAAHRRDHARARAGGYAKRYGRSGIHV